MKTIIEPFKIKSVEGIDDYAMIAEVVRRRYKYALRGEELWPDLILIDGGLGHLRRAQRAINTLMLDAAGGPGSLLPDVIISTLRSTAIDIRRRSAKVSPPADPGFDISRCSTRPSRGLR